MKGKLKLFWLLSTRINGMSPVTYAKIKQFEISSEKLIEHYKKCTGKKKDYIRKHLLPESDMWMTPEEAIEHGIADKVIETYWQKRIISVY